MNPALQKLIAEQPKDMASRDRLSLKIVRKILGTAAVPVGFQHRQEISDFEQEVEGFPTSDVIATLIREERKTLLRSEISKQKTTLERLFRRIAAVSTREELSRKCFDVSLGAASMVEALGIRAVVYMGTLIVEDKETGEGHSWYFLNDVFSPPVDSQARGHSWIFTSCFSVIDLTAKFQDLAEGTHAKVPSPVLIEKSPVMPFQEKWYFSRREEEAVKARKREWLNANGALAWNEVNVNQHLDGGASIYYMPMRTVFAEPLEAIKTNVTFGGLKPCEFLEDFKRSSSATIQPCIS